MLEVVAVIGSLLLALDHCIPAYTRERAVVTHVRVRGGATAVGPSLNAVIALATTSSGIRPGTQKPAGELRHFLKALLSRYSAIDACGYMSLFPTCWVCM